jgi:hypothetical protein
VPDTKRLLYISNNNRKFEEGKEKESFPLRELISLLRLGG